MSIAITTNRPGPDALLGLRARGSSQDYWNARAERYASVGAGLAAVCSFGMPEYHNQYIHWQQAHALQPWLEMPAGARVLEIGCGVGRWTRRLARTGANVVGFDLSARMIADARRRAEADGVAANCRFFVSDVADFSIDRTFDRILGVTVLQHILDEQRFASAVRNIARHLAPGGRALLLEAAPTRRTPRCDTAIFVARPDQAYLDVFRAAGLSCAAVRGVDPAPFRTWMLPYYRSAPRALAAAGMFAATALSVPFDLLAPPAIRDRAWHKVFVLEHATAPPSDSTDEVRRR